MGIKHSLSAAGKPRDNAPMESFYNNLKMELLKSRVIRTFEDLKRELPDWVYWFNHERPHSSLNYETPVKKGEHYEPLHK